MQSNKNKRTNKQKIKKTGIHVANNKQTDNLTLCHPKSKKKTNAKRKY